MNPTQIVMAVNSVLGLVSMILPIVGVKNTEALGGIVKTLTDLAPLVIDQIGSTYTGVKNVINSVRGKLTVEEQLAALDAFDAQVDAAWDAIEAKIDPDQPATA